MEIVTWNVNGLRSIIRKGFIDWLQKSSPDVVCLQEIKAKPEQLPLDKFYSLGYNHYISSAQKPCYAGTLILSKNKAVKENYSMQFERFDSEGRITEIGLGEFDLINLYLPHGGRQKENLEYKLECYEKLLKYCREKKNAVLVGDFNIACADIDLARPKQNINNIMFSKEERKIFSHLLKTGFIDAFRSLYPIRAGAYTWWPYMHNARERNLGWRIDYILLPKSFKSIKYKAEIRDEVLGSDHCPVSLKINP